MFIGIVNFCNKNTVPSKLINVLTTMEYKVAMISSKTDYYEIIKKSPIKHWIFSSSPDETQSLAKCEVNMKIFQLKSKSFFVIGRAMEKVLMQLNNTYVVPTKSRKNKKPMAMNKTSHRLFDKMKKKIKIFGSPGGFDVIDTKHVKVINQRDGKIMTATYKNAILTQYYPFESEDGQQIILNWLS
jgi:hypothetical protein